MDAVLADVCLVKAWSVPIARTIVAAELRCMYLAVGLHVISAATSPAVIRTTANCRIGDATMGFNGVRNLLHAQASSHLAFVSSKNKLDSGLKRSSGIIERGVGIGVQKFQSFNEYIETNLIPWVVAHGRPQSDFTRQVLSIYLSDNRIQTLQVKTKILVL